jgi:acetyl-CoA acetyltransferase
MNERNQRFLGRTAVAGVGFTEFSRNSGQSVLSLATQACRNAIDDAGIPVADVDGIVSFQFQEDSVPTQAVATALGLPQANYLLDTALGGQAPCYLVMQAAMAIDAGLADNVLVFRALNGRSGNRVGTAKSSGPATGFRYPIGLSAYLQVIALWARRFMIETGATPEDLASVPLAQRQYAAKNERAMINKPMTLDEYMAKDFVAEPFRAADCTIEVDGACAVLVTSLDRSRDMQHAPAVIRSARYVAGFGSGLDMGDALLWPDLSKNYTSLLRSDLWGASGIGPKDVDMAQLYDCFSSSVLFAMEGLGLVERGGSGAFIRSGATLPGGELPINTNGGLICEGYLHGMTTVAEAVLQLQQRCGERTVDGVETCVVTSGALQDGSAMVLSQDR